MAVKKAFPILLNFEKDVIQFPVIPFNLGTLLRDKKGSRRMFSVLTSSKKITRTFITKWNSKLQI